MTHDKDESNICEMSRNINDESYCVQEWLNVNKLPLNVPYTNYLIFYHRQRKLDAFIHDIRINYPPIERITDFNFLGLQIDPNLNWNAHIQKTPIKYLILWESWIVLNAIHQKKILCVSYNSLILPHLQYAILSWGSELMRLSKLQNRAIRVITCSKFNAHREPLFNSLRAIFFRGSKNIYSNFMSLLHIDMTQVLKILPHVRPGPTYST